MLSGRPGRALFRKDPALAGAAALRLALAVRGWAGLRG
jgi:hypothetical protein